MFRVSAILLALFSARCAFAQTAPTSQPSSPFIFVLIDDSDEKEIGARPFSRTVYTRAIDRAADAGSFGVVIKFFLDQPKDEVTDLALAASMRKTKVLLQARIDDETKDANPFPERFFLDAKGSDQSLAGSAGWIPLPKFADAAHGIGFVDSLGTDSMPLVERYQGRSVRSMATCCVEMATDGSLRLHDGRAFFGERSLAMDVSGARPIRYPQRDNLPSISLRKFMAEDFDRVSIRDRIVVLGCDDHDMPKLRTPLGEIGVHRIFCYGLLSVMQDLDSAPR